MAAAYSGAADASHYYWHLHAGYPAVPNGYSQIVNEFGQPCNSQFNDNTRWWYASDDGQNYLNVLHHRLGPSSGGSNEQDVYMHIYGEYGLGGAMKHGIYGANCRYISGTTTWSTHAWGIAMDINTAPNHSWERHCHIHDLHDGIRSTYSNHKWSEISCDAGHFQYATGY